MAYDKVVDSAVLDANLTSIADAIRAKAGTSDKLAFPAGFADAIAGIEAGGGSNMIFNEYRYAAGTFTPAEDITTMYTLDTEELSDFDASKCTIFLFPSFDSDFENGLLASMYVKSNAIASSKKRAYSSISMEGGAFYAREIEVATVSSGSICFNFTKKAGVAGVRYNWLVLEVVL